MYTLQLKHIHINKSQLMQKKALLKSNSVHDKNLVTHAIIMEGNRHSIYLFKTTPLCNIT